MADYQGISSSIFDEPEYRDPTELLLAVYIMTRRDMLGVCPFRVSTVAAACRTTTRKINRTVDYFAEIDKIKVGLDRSHLWLKSGLYHSLYKGRYSLTQLSSATGLLLKWHCAGVFGDCFAEEVLQLYSNKYSIDIPYPYPTPTPTVLYYSQSESESDTHTINPKAKEAKSNIQEFDSWWNDNDEKIREITLAVIRGKEWNKTIIVWIEVELAKMRSWLVSDPTRRKKRWGAFVRNWLTLAWEKNPVMGGDPEEAERIRLNRAKNVPY